VLCLVLKTPRQAWNDVDKLESPLGSVAERITSNEGHQFNSHSGQEGGFALVSSNLVLVFEDGDVGAVKDVQGGSRLRQDTFLMVIVTVDRSKVACDCAHDDWRLETPLAGLCKVVWR
jgi:hypothetical protein